MSVDLWNSGFDGVCKINVPIRTEKRFRTVAISCRNVDCTNHKRQR